MEIRYLGHSSFFISFNGFKILFDPFITPNDLAKDIIDIKTLDPDYILISHAHQDHTHDAEEILKSSNATLIAIHEIATYYQNKGITNVHGMNLGGKNTFDFGTVHMVQAIHSSSFLDGTYGGCPSGFVIESGNRTYYYAGDTALFSDMKMIGENFKLDIAFLPIGDNYTMGIEDAVLATNYLKVDKFIGMHYDTFPVIEIDHIQCDYFAKRNDKKLILLPIGGSINL